MAKRPCPKCGEVRCVCALTENQRLLAAHKGISDGKSDVIRQLEAEIDRLRAVLESIYPASLAAARRIAQIEIDCEKALMPPDSASPQRE